MVKWKKSAKVALLSAAATLLILIGKNSFESLESFEPKLSAKSRRFQPSNVKSSTNVLLVAYFRGGSTLLGQLFNKYENTLYWFEPLYAMEKTDVTGTYFDEINTADASLDIFNSVQHNKSHKSYGTLEVTHQVLPSIFNCRIASIDQNILAFQLQNILLQSDSMATYAECVFGLLKHDGVEYNERVDLKYVERCRHFIQYPCQSATLRVIKTIRVPLVYVVDLIRKNRDLKVVYSIRNPLAMFNSGRLFISKGEDYVRGLCQRIHVDWLAAVWLQKEYPNNILVVKYEDLAVNTLDTAKDIYNFVGIRIPETLTQQTNAKLGSGSNTDPFSTNKNATKAAYRWKEDMHPGAIQTIADLCSKVIGAMGYTDDIIWREFK